MHFRLGVMLSAILLTTGPAPAEPADRAGLVDIGSGRQLFLKCRGSGAPTVVLIAGGFEAGWIWTYGLAPDDPVHDAPEDALSVGGGQPQKLGTAIFPTAAGFTRVGLYDRPNTTLGDDIAGERSGLVSAPVAQPHLLEEDVADLHALLAATGEPGPLRARGALLRRLDHRALRPPPSGRGGRRGARRLTSVYLRETPHAG